MQTTLFPFEARGAGILLHVSSLPSPWGIGDFGPQALAWIDRLAEAGLGWWQFLPLSPAGRGNSPYESFSTFALNETLISPDALIDEGLLGAKGIAGPAFDERAVDFPTVAMFKRQLLKQVPNTFRSLASAELQRSYEDFCRTQAHWLEDYALFRAIREAQNDTEYRHWPRELALRDPSALAQAQQALAETVDRFRLAQFVAHRQTERLKAYARQKGVRLIGDLPIFVSIDSADVWARPELFLIDAKGEPTFVAGVPPDYFSSDGQLWGSPLYDWKTHRTDGYAWWIERIRSLLLHVDVIRLDHFRAFAAAWHIPAGSTTAKTGEWQPGPGADFFVGVQARLGRLPLIAEDLGLITPDVVALRDEFHFPGMRVLQFAFDGDPKNIFLPEYYAPPMVAYTATHDNNTARGWYDEIPETEREYLWKYLQRPAGSRDDAAWELLRLAWESRAVMAVTPLQDLLEVGSESRMNWPGRPIGNWRWRVTPEQLSSVPFDRVRDLAARTGRTNGASARVT
jgi:4-alpha-glucanotransferase